MECLRPSAQAALMRRESYLDAAESTFIRFGYEGASMRLIATEARVGVGTITHHWKSKQALLMEVFERRLYAALREQEEGLQACAERCKRGETLEMSEVVRALLKPLYVPVGGDTAGADRVRRLFSFLITEPSTTVLQFNRQVFGRIGFIFHDLVRTIGSPAEPEVLHWLFCCVVGCNFFPLSLGDRVSEVTGEPKSPPDWERVLDIVTGFIVRGLTLPSSRLR